MAKTLTIFSQKNFFHMIFTFILFCVQNIIYNKNLLKNFLKTDKNEPQYILTMKTQTKKSLFKDFQDIFVKLKAFQGLENSFFKFKAI